VKQQTDLIVGPVYLLLTSVKEFSDLNHLSSVQQNQLSTVKSLGKTQKVDTLLDAERTHDITRHNKQVKKKRREVRGVSKKFGEWYQKTNKTEDTNKLTLLAFKIIAILHNTLLATFIKLLETVSKGLFRNRSQNRCHTFLDCRNVCKTCVFHDALQAGKQKEVHPTYSPDLAPACARSGD
jgi:hypothetical protein